MALYVGLDVSLKTASICIIEADGTPVWEGKAESEPVPLVKALSRWWDRIALVGLEFRVLAESAGSVNLHSLGEAGEGEPGPEPDAPNRPPKAMHPARTACGIRLPRRAAYADGTMIRRLVQLRLRRSRAAARMTALRSSPLKSLIRDTDTASGNPDRFSYIRHHPVFCGQNDMSSGETFSRIIRSAASAARAGSCSARHSTHSTFIPSGHPVQ